MDAYETKIVERLSREFSQECDSAIKNARESGYTEDALNTVYTQIQKSALKTLAEITKDMKSTTGTEDETRNYAPILLEVTKRNQEYLRKQSDEGQRYGLPKVQAMDVNRTLKDQGENIDRVTIDLTSKLAENYNDTILELRNQV